MRLIFVIILLTGSIAAQEMPGEDAIRIGEFYRLSAQIQDSIWPEWSKTPAPLLLITADTEFLTPCEKPRGGFKKISENVCTRPRVFPAGFLATFPVFGPPSVIVVGEPKNTEAASSTPWLIVVMHEHFHQLQHGRAGYQQAVDALDLSNGDKTGMWMLNYPFPYDEPEVVRGFSRLRDLLLAALSAAPGKDFDRAAATYVRERKKVFGKLSEKDHKYFSFQLWQEGIARYTQVKAAEASADYKPSSEFASLSDYIPFSDYAPKARKDTLDELKQADIAKMKRVFVYSFGAAEGMLLDRWNPGWKQAYFEHLLSTDSLFDDRGSSETKRPQTEASSSH